MDYTKPPTRYQKFLRKTLTGIICHPRVRSLILRLHKQKYAGGTKIGRLSMFFSLDDPYLPLIVEQVAALSKNYRVELTWIPIATAYAPADPQSAMRQQYMLRDASREARLHGLRTFTTAPDVKEVQKFIEIAASLAPVVLAAWVPQAVNHLWYGDEAPVSPAVDTTHAASKLAENARERERLGHYEVGMLKFDMDWYWAYGRLDFLTERLSHVGLQVAKP